MKEKKLVMLIDDDSVCNRINQIIIKKKFKSYDVNEYEVLSFQKPVEGLKYLIKSLKNKVYRKILVLLDINMPVMTGWELLEQYSAIPRHETEVVIYILSSSIYKGDKERVNENPIIAEFISKPITPFAVDKFFKKME